MVSGVSCNRKSRNPRCLWTWLGVQAAAPVAVLRFGRCTRCVVKVFGEISDVIPSDAHQMDRFQCCKWEISKTINFGKNPDTSWIFMIFHGFERDKPLQTVSTSTALRVRRSVCFLSHYSRYYIRKTTKSSKIDSKKDTKSSKSDQELDFWIPTPGGAPSPCRAGYSSNESV